MIFSQGCITLAAISVLDLCSKNKKVLRIVGGFFCRLRYDESLEFGECCNKNPPDGDFVLPDVSDNSVLVLGQFCQGKFVQKTFFDGTKK